MGLMQAWPTAWVGHYARLNHCMFWSLSMTDLLHGLVIIHARPTPWVGHYARATHCMCWSALQSCRYTNNWHTKKNLRIMKTLNSIIFYNFRLCLWNIAIESRPLLPLFMKHCNRIKPIIIIFTPVAWGDKNSANVCPCTCRKRRLIIGYKLSYTTGLLYAWSSCMQWGVWVWTVGHRFVLVQVIYCSKGGWVIFFNKNQRIPESRSWVTATVVTHHLVLHRCISLRTPSVPSSPWEDRSSSRVSSPVTYIYTCWKKYRHPKRFWITIVIKVISINILYNI